MYVEKRKNAGVTQVVESQPSKLLVAGSSPVSRSKRELSADVAQLVEHILGKDEVTGSIPVISSNAEHETRNPSLQKILIKIEDRAEFLSSFIIYGCSSIGRVAVSKTVGWGFESSHPCTKINFKNL